MSDNPIVTTVTELDELPHGSVIRDARGEVCERWSFVGSLGWLATGDSERRWRITFPVTVLYHPTQVAERDKAVTVDLTEPEGRRWIERA